jgi:NAD(P)-dependent dehydrogenase (short-subunit alcohol dehydrogenase family)
MTTTLITGANKGLGYETARQLIALGHTVYVTARDPELRQQAAAALGACWVQLDVTDDASVEAAVGVLREEVGHLDVLVNNAGISGGFIAAEDTNVEDVRKVYDTNVFGVVRVTRAFLPLLQKSAAPVIVNVSSGMGSLTITTDPTRFEQTLKGRAHPSSKSALNMLTSQYAKSLPWSRVNAVDPGYTAHRPQRPPRHPDHRAGSGRDRTDGVRRRGRSDWNVHRCRGRGALVIECIHDRRSNFLDPGWRLCISGIRHEAA